MPGPCAALHAFLELHDDALEQGAKADNCEDLQHLQNDVARGDHGHIPAARGKRAQRSRNWEPRRAALTITILPCSRTRSGGVISPEGG